MNFFTKVILGSVAVLLAATAVLYIFRSREGDRVEALLREAVGWAERGETDRVLDLVDEHFEDGAEEARAEIRRRIKPGAFESLEVVEVEAGVDGSDAHAKITVRIKTRDMPMAVPQTYSVTLRKRDAGWKVIRVRGDERLR
ncbi:MAG TPA: hypothetical protein VFC86_10985 [Planctomycetota bacterium]|nr:hypothetical protein [Planctomycetota bacterium]